METKIYIYHWSQKIADLLKELDAVNIDSSTYTIESDLLTLVGYFAYHEINMTITYSNGERKVGLG